MKISNKSINIIAWTVIILLILAYVFLIAPIIGALVFFGTLLSAGATPPLIFIYLFFFLPIQIISLIPTLLFLKIDKKIFIRNYKYISLVNIFIALSYTIELFR